MSTKEGAVKKAVKEVLAEYKIMPASDAGKEGINSIYPDGVDGWYFMPGSSGFGTSGIPDFVGHYRNRFFSIETKKPGGRPKGFQALQVAAILASGGYNLVIDGEETLSEFRRWLDDIT